MSPHSKVGGFRNAGFVECCGQRLHGLVPFTAVQLRSVLRVATSCFTRAVAFYQFNLAVLTTELFYLLDRVTPLRRGYGGEVSLQISRCTLLQFAVNSLVVGIPVGQQTLR